MFNFSKTPIKEDSTPTSLQITSSNKKIPSFSTETTDVTHSSILSESLLSTPAVFFLNEFLDLESFKTQPCVNTYQHNFKTCTFYHNFKDRRRTGGFYSSDLCKTPEECPLGDNCLFSHNYIEQMYQREKYKTKFCGYYPNNLKSCEYGVYCSFAHSENEIIIDLIHNYEFDEDFYMFHYKTIWCPYNLSLHDKALCVYAHNWQDFRRKPHLFEYEEKGCSLWKYNEVLLNYDQGCPNGLNCKFTHGWKELEFHPFNYKLKSCSAGKNCTKGSICPFYHSAKDKRVLSGNLASKLFKLHPRNRIISNTFKVRLNRSYLCSIREEYQNNKWPQSKFINFERTKEQKFLRDPEKPKNSFMMNSAFQNMMDVSRRSSKNVTPFFND